jgi:type I restriction enzyme S subunit
LDGVERCIDDEIPFDLPDSWMWVQLGELITVKGGKRLPFGCSLSTTPSDHIYIRVTDMKSGSIDDHDLHYIPDDVYRKISSYVIEENDLYIVIVGSTIGKVGRVPNTFHGMNLTENAARLIPHLIDKEYLLLALMNDFMQSQFTDKTNQVGQPKLALERLKTSHIPIPPLTEQKRIVLQANNLIETCGNLS